MKKTHLTIKLAEGRKLFHPSNMVLMEPEKPYTVLNNLFWRRRLQDGDVVHATKETPTKKPTFSSKNKEK